MNVFEDEAMMRRLQKALKDRIEAGDPCGPFYAAIVDSNGGVVAASSIRRARKTEGFLIDEGPVPFGKA